MNQSNLNRTINGQWRRVFRSFRIGHAHRYAPPILTFAQFALAGLVTVAAAPPARASIPAAQYYFEADGLQNISDAVMVLAGSKALAAGAGAHAPRAQSIATGYGAAVTDWGGIAPGSGAGAVGAAPGAGTPW